MIRSADRLAALLGIEPDSRQVNVEKLYLSTEKTPGAYWLQLFIATGIAFLGLTLDSTAVIIGAMLVSPLMTPIVQVGMGFAVGHVHLTLRASVRLLLSIGLVMGAAALMTTVMPLQELTGEILARTRPTFLDLIVALFCGLAASFTTARGSRDTVTAAAGTAIAIALVPPICVIGFGLGLGDAEVARGAALLFTANLAAIILVSDFFFLITGFNRLDFERLNQRVYTDEDRTRRLYRLAQALLPPESVKAMTVRLVLPLGFVATVAVPLYQALHQVVLQVRVKQAAQAIIGGFEKTHDVLRHDLEITPERVFVKVTMVGQPADQAGAEQALRQALDERLEVPVTVGVVMLASSEFMQQRLEGSSRQLREQLAALQAPLACPPPPAAPDLDAVRAEAVQATPGPALAAQLTGRVGAVLAWARPATPGRWLGWSLDLSAGGARLRLGLLADAEPGADALALLATVVAKETGLAVTGVMVDRLAPTLLDEAEAAAAEPPRELEAARRLGGLRFRLTTPAHPDAAGQAATAALAAALAGLPVERATGPGWKLEALPAAP
ncbi:MAG: TIGR00341 family protein [Myxococcales bacterium]|nr:TIGR00341 family protein [Myxococcales bacterium]